MCGGTTATLNLSQHVDHLIMAEVLRRAPPIVWYSAVSLGLLGVVVARALDTYHNFFAAAFALSHSNGSILVRLSCT
jgi:hypothetical protein